MQLELHRALLGKLIRDYEGVRALALHNLNRARIVVRGDQALGWLDEWRELLEGPAEQLVDVLLGDDEHSVDLRQVGPFAGALTHDERVAAITRAGSRAPPLSSNTLHPAAARPSHQSIQVHTVRLTVRGQLIRVDIRCTHGGNSRPSRAYPRGRQVVAPQGVADEITCSSRRGVRRRPARGAGDGRGYGVARGG